MFREFDDDAGLIKKAIETVSAVIGPPDPGYTKKVIRWERPTITVNLFRETHAQARLCIAGRNIHVSGEHTLGSEGAVALRAPPKNSNCSKIVKAGPTIWTAARDVSDFEKLKSFVQYLAGDGCVTDGNIVEIDEFEPEEDEVLELREGERKLSTQPLDLTVDLLVTRIDRGSLVLQPEFQRDYVWSSAKASQLIESILMGIPLPIVYLAETPDSDWEVVDGQQRLTSIYSYVRGAFPGGVAFRLGRLNVRSDLQGKGFKDLSKAEQNAILNYTLRAIVLKNESHPDVKFEVFERLNCGSVQLKDAELRNCMYRGAYNDMLAALSQNPMLLKVRRSDAPHKRMEDRQLILRFLAMKRNTHLNYRGAMKQFMNREMQAHRHASPAEVAALSRTFEEAIECAWLVFGDNAFRRWNPGRTTADAGDWESKINIALWDTLLYGFAFYEKRQIIPVADAIREEFLDIMSNDATFVDYIGRSTDKPERLQYRARVWLDRLEAVVATPASEARSFSRRLKESLFSIDPTCAICQQRVPSADDAEIDHVEHYWRGGATIPENARLTHRHCNRVRGGRG